MNVHDELLGVPGHRAERAFGDDAWDVATVSSSTFEDVGVSSDQAEQTISADWPNQRSPSAVANSCAFEQEAAEETEHCCTALCALCLLLFHSYLGSAAIVARSMHTGGHVHFRLFCVFRGFHLICLPCMVAIDTIG